MAKQSATNQQRGFCDICSCNVSGPWDVHAAGIRHRRNTVRLRFGSGDAQHVVSVFEDTSSRSTPRARSRDPVLAHQPAPAPHDARHANAQRRATLPPVDDAAARVSSAVLRQLVHETGTNGHLYHAAARRFTPDALRQATPQHSRLLQLASSSHTYTHPLHSPVAQLAVLAGSLPLPDGVTTLHVNVPFQTYGAECLATIAALRLLAASLRRDTLLQRLHLSIQLEGYVQALVQGGTGFNRLPVVWGHVLTALRSALDANTALCEIRLQAPPGVLPADEVGRLHSHMVLQPQRLRMAVMLGQHPRAGAGSQVHRLPAALMEKVVEAAVPLRQRVLVEDAFLPQLRDSSSSSSSEEESSSGEDSSSSGEEEGGEDDGGSSSSSSDDGGEGL